MRWLGHRDSKVVNCYDHLYDEEWGVLLLARERAKSGDRDTAQALLARAIELRLAKQCRVELKALVLAAYHHGDPREAIRITQDVIAKAKRSDTPDDFGQIHPNRLQDEGKQKLVGLYQLFLIQDGHHDEAVSDALQHDLDGLVGAALRTNGSSTLQKGDDRDERVIYDQVRVFRRQLRQPILSLDGAVPPHSTLNQ